ncbi:MAG: molybdenum cofactor guanylyltransferase [Bacteroidales bacterium]|nr:molybdenum cofactor guanylyltransferase [Bacteroidales bacterium]
MEQKRLGNITAIVLAGGRSTRMEGKDKSLLSVNGVPLIRYITDQLRSHFGEIIIGGDPHKYSFLGYRVIPDEIEGKGPLMGLYSCLAASGTELNFITACDIPEIKPEFVESMLMLSEGFDIVMPVNETGEYEPLHAIYRRTVRPVAGKLLGESRLKLSDLAGLVRTRHIRFDSRGWYHNINNKDDYENYERRSYL